MQILLTVVNAVQQLVNKHIHTQTHIQQQFIMHDDNKNRFPLYRFIQVIYFHRVGYDCISQSAVKNTAGVNYPQQVKHQCNFNCVSISVASKQHTQDKAWKLTLNWSSKIGKCWQSFVNDDSICLSKVCLHKTYPQSEYLEAIKCIYPKSQDLK